MRKMLKNEKIALLLFAIALIANVSGWICIDWVLNFSVYQGMITDLWLMQIPFTSIEIAMSPWQAYYLSFLQIEASIALLVYALISLFHGGRK